MGSTEDPMYLALTDYPYPQRFDINTLDTLELLRPANGFGMTGCTHWQREPDTDNSINFACKVKEPHKGTESLFAQNFYAKYKFYTKYEQYILKAVHFQKQSFYLRCKCN